MVIDPRNLTIQRYPAAILRRKAEPIETVDETVRAVAERMMALMHEAEGVGLAGPQVGLPWRIFVTAGDAEGEGAPDRAYINPELHVLRSEMQAVEEGCLSLPGITAEIRRPKAATIRATDLQGQTFEMTDEDYLARVWQHEYDHLEGVLIIDKMMPVDRLANRRAIRDMERQEA